MRRGAVKDYNSLTLNSKTLNKKQENIMKRNRLFLLATLLPVMAMQAQTSYEAAALLDADLSGTARYVGMGGAMSALGADMSTMSTNPAGTALYRSWDVALSFGGNGVTQRTQSNAGGMRAVKGYGTLDNVGVVIANKHSNEGIVRFINFGFNYHNVKRFGGKMGMTSNLGGQFSQTEQMEHQALENVGYVDYTYFDPESANNFFDKANTQRYFGDFNYGWLTLLGAYGELIGMYAKEDEAGNVLVDERGEPWHMLTNEGCYSERVSGRIDAYDFNLSFNLVDAVYLGATLTRYSVDRLVESSYTEIFADGDYTLDSFHRTTGSGYDLKFGLIVRPFSESSFRVGLSATTPAVYTLRDYNSAIIRSAFTSGDYWELDTYDQAAYGDDYITDYTMTTPAKVNVSVGGTVGTSLALGAEYEYTDYGATKLYYSDGVEYADMNAHTKENFNGQHTLRLGAEKTFGAFYTRLGYNYQTGGYKQDAFKAIPIASVQTNTAYSNIRSTQNFTCGIGYRGNVFYADAALLYSTQKADFYPFDTEGLQATNLTRNLAKGMVTVGMRF